MKEKRFFIDFDEDGAWYLIPDSNRDEWEKWLKTDWQSELSECVAPDFAIPLDELSAVTFTDPIF